MTSINNKEPFPCARSCVCHFIAMQDFKSSRNAVIGAKSSILQPLWPWNLAVDLENQYAPLLCHLKLCVPFRCHLWLYSRVTVRKRSFGVKIVDFSSCVTLKFDGWHEKTTTTGHLFYAISSSVHYFEANYGFKLKLKYSGVLTVKNIHMIWFVNHAGKVTLVSYVSLVLSTFYISYWKINLK